MLTTLTQFLNQFIPLIKTNNNLWQLTNTTPKSKDKLKKPKNAHFEYDAKEKRPPREYFDIDDFPIECTTINDEGEKDLEIVRIIGFLTQAVRDLAEEVDLLKKNKK